MAELPGILVVCSANICRSPLAEAMIVEAFAERFVKIRCYSAGILGIKGRAAAAYSQLAAAERNKRLLASLQRHKSQGVTGTLVAEADRILCMEDEHAEWIVERWPHAEPKVQLIGILTDTGQVSDPYGGKPDDYRATADILQGCADALVLEVLGPKED